MSMESLLQTPLTIKPDSPLNLAAILLIVLTIPLWLAIYLVTDLWKEARSP